MARRKGSKDKQKRKLSLGSKLGLGGIVLGGGAVGTGVGTLALAHKVKELDDRIRKSTVETGEKVWKKYKGNVPDGAGDKLNELYARKVRVAGKSVLKAAPKVLLLGAGGGLAAGGLGAGLLYHHLKNKNDSKK